MSIKKYILSVLLLAGVITLFAYYFLGGFKERSLAMVEVNDYHLVGKLYEGSLRNKQLEEIFYEVSERVRQGAEPAGTFAIVVLKEPENEKDTIRQFIGILQDEPVGEVPAGWERFRLDADKVVRSTIRSHNLVMPKPNEIREEMQEFAQAQGKALQPGITIEKYLGERHLQIEVPLQ